MASRNQAPAGGVLCFVNPSLLLRCQRADGQVLVPTVGEYLPTAADTTQHGDPLAWNVHALAVGQLHVVRVGAEAEGGVASDLHMSCLDG